MNKFSIYSKFQDRDLNLATVFLSKLCFPKLSNWLLSPSLCASQWSNTQSRQLTSQRILHQVPLLHDQRLAILGTLFKIIFHIFTILCTEQQNHQKLKGRYSKTHFTNNSVDINFEPQSLIHTSKSISQLSTVQVNKVDCLFIGSRFQYGFQIINYILGK